MILTPFMAKWMICIFINALIVVAHDPVFNKEKGLTILDLLKVLIVILLGPIGLLMLLCIIYDDIVLFFNKCLNFYIIKPEIKIKTDKAELGRNKIQTLMPQKS